MSTFTDNWPLICMLARIDQGELILKLVDMDMPDIAVEMAQVKVPALAEKVGAKGITPHPDTTYTGGELTMLVLCALKGLSESGVSRSELIGLLESMRAGKLTTEVLEKVMKGAR